MNIFYRSTNSSEIFVRRIRCVPKVGGVNSYQSICLNLVEVDGSSRLEKSSKTIRIVTTHEVSTLVNRTNRYMVSRINRWSPFAFRMKSTA